MRIIINLCTDRTSVCINLIGKYIVVKVIYTMFYFYSNKHVGLVNSGVFWNIPHIYIYIYRFEPSQTGFFKYIPYGIMARLSTDSSNIDIFTWNKLKYKQ